ncbi:MAG: hypothetical protein JXQ73_12020 [Phycisphaerae bacterium]|nr:hypothetical protein [Phycisphaerae bacterium]
MILQALITVLSTTIPASPPIDVASRRQLFVDRYLIDTMHGAELRLHHPTPREIAIVHDRPWEGSGCAYMTVFKDADTYRMYYRGAHGVYTPGKFESPHEEVTCYAESKDGKRWTKPDLGLFDFQGSKSNNIILTPSVCKHAAHNFCPLPDARPGVPADERYKALGGVSGGAYAFVSPDGIHWKMLGDKPVLTAGAFDSQNLAFWDAVAGEYRAYFRDFRDGRDIKMATSKDFRKWSEPVWLEYSPARSAELYTNQILPYYRAPHLYLGFPTRYIDRGWCPSTKALPQLEYRKIRGSKSQREGTALTDGMFMSSHDGLQFNVWPESFIRPGLRFKDNWFYGDNYQNLGLVETASDVDGAPDELSIYVLESAAQGENCWHRRFTLRIDGFVSVAAPMAGGQMITKPIVFQGKQLTLNFSTSAAGSIRVEIQDAIGHPIKGFALADCPEIFGDDLERPVAWNNGGDLTPLAGKPVRLRFTLKDADLYSLQFRP